MLGSFLKFPFSHTQRGFTLVELIIGMTIFAIGLSAIFALLQSTMGNAAYSRHEIVVANLLREQIELVKNIRDTNIRGIISWDSARIEALGSIENSFSSGMYIVENNYSASLAMIDPSSGILTGSPVFMKRLNPLSADIKTVWESTRLSLDSQGRYTHSVTGMPTPYASYIRLTPLTYFDAGGKKEIENLGKTQGYTIDARVIVFTRGAYREYDAKSIITDWIK